MSRYDRNVTWSICNSTWHVIMSVVASVLIVLKTRHRKQKIAAQGTTCVWAFISHGTEPTDTAVSRTVSRVVLGRHWDKIWQLKYIFYRLGPSTLIFLEFTCTFHSASLIFLLLSSFIIWMNPVHDTEVWPDGLIQEDMRLCVAAFTRVQKSLSINLKPLKKACADTHALTHTYDFSHLV